MKYASHNLQLRRFVGFGTICTILKNVKNTQGKVLLQMVPNRAKELY